jgi:hypothetical protein
MTRLELNDRDKAALTAVLRATIAADRYPFSPRVRQLRAILERLEPPRARPEPLPPHRRAQRGAAEEAWPAMTVRLASLVLAALLLANPTIAFADYSTSDLYEACGEPKGSISEGSVPALSRGSSRWRSRCMPLMQFHRRSTRAY